MVIFAKREYSLVAIPLEKIIVVEMSGASISIHYHTGYFYSENGNFAESKNDVGKIEILYLMADAALKQMQDFYKAVAKNQNVFTFDSGSGINGKG